MITKISSLGLIALVVLLFSSTIASAGGEQTNFGIGLKGGINRLEGDWSNPSFKPAIYGQLIYNLFDYLAICAEGGYAKVGTKDNTAIETILIPYEGHLMFSFYPLGWVNPYVILGGGGVFWNYTENGQTKVDPNTGKYFKGYDSFLKSGGGLEFSLNRARTFYFNIGATYRLSFTDWLDLRKSGNENDGVIDVYGGLTFYFRTNARGDRDNDGVPDELDLKPDIKEDADGYMDHDGKPEGIPPITIPRNSASNDEIDRQPPVVIHSPVRRVESGKDIRIRSDIYEDRKLKVASILYRPVGSDQWKVGQLLNVGGTLYEGVIPGRSVQKQGVEYCVIAVDEAISGIGYSGLPKIPNRVEVLGHPKFWRIIAGSAALIGWGASGYYILKKQK